MDNMEKNFKVIQDLIDRAFKRLWLGDKEEGGSLKGLDLIYESIEDYTKKTGKRFRMTKDQKSRGLSRDEAFAEFVRTVS